MITCPHCNFANTDGRTVCKSCGKALSDAPVAVQFDRACPYCAETIKAAAVVCRFCGREVEAAPPPLWAPPPAPAALAEKPPAPKTSGLVWMTIGVVGLLVVIVSILWGGSGRSTSSTPTPDPLTQLVQPDDFPGRYHIRAEPLPTTLYPGLPRTRYQGYYEIIAGSDSRNEVGHIAIVVFPGDREAQVGYAIFAQEAELGKQTSPLALGEVGSQSWPSPNWDASDVLFRRCNAVVHMTLQDNTLELLVAAAQRVHDRLQPLVC